MHKKSTGIRFYDGCGRGVVGRVSDEALWLGIHTRETEAICTEKHMKLTRETTAALLPVLEYFVVTGELPPQHPSTLWLRRLLYRLVCVGYRIKLAKLAMSFNSTEGRIYRDTRS